MTLSLIFSIFQNQTEHGLKVILINITYQKDI
jgi:hypothetical protein